MTAEAPSLWRSRPHVGLIAGPLVLLLMLLLPPPENLSTEGWRVAAVGLLMATWWVTEAIPIPATALLPIVLFPVLGVGTIASATQPFANPLIYLFMGGFIIARAMERSNLHMRIALNIVRRVGVSPQSIIAGVMLAAAFLSMWVSNTATALMLLPVALSIVALVKPEPSADGEVSDAAPAFAVALLLALAYGCNIGGIATLIGTPPNALMAAYMLETHGVQIGFGQWMLIGLPLVVVSLPLTYWLLTRLLFPVSMQSLPGGAAFVEDRLRELGRMSRAENFVATVFGLVATLWIVRPLLENVLPGISDTGIAIFGSILLFAVPISWRRREFALNWEDARKLPWGVLILFGGGLSLAGGITSSGLARWIGGSLQALEAFPLLALVVFALLLIIFLTEVTSNTAIAATFLPIFASVAVAMGYDPLLLAIPAGIGASCAFMLPVATPPNAIVFGSGMVSIPQMAKAGVWLNFMMVIVITAILYALVGAVFGVNL